MLSMYWIILIAIFIGIGIVVIRYRHPLLDWANKYNAAITAIATAVIAVFTIVLVWSTMDQNDESRREYRATHRAHIIINIEAADFEEFDGKAFVVIPMRNDGGSPATEVIEYFAPLFVPPNKHLDYAKLRYATGTFNPGLSIGQGQSHKFYGVITKQQETAIKNWTLGFRLVGRITYWDDFGPHCEPYAAQFVGGNVGPPHFEALFVPPISAVCNPAPEMAKMFPSTLKTSLLELLFTSAQARLFRTTQVGSRSIPLPYRKRHIPSPTRTPACPSQNSRSDQRVKSRILAIAFACGCRRDKIIR